MYFKGLCLLKSKTVDFGGFRTKKFTNFETLFGLKTKMRSFCAHQKGNSLYCPSNTKTETVSSSYPSNSPCVSYWCISLVFFEKYCLLKMQNRDRLQYGKARGMNREAGQYVFWPHSYLWSTIIQSWVFLEIFNRFSFQHSLALTSSHLPIWVKTY